MTLNIALQMDPIAEVDIHGDSSFALALEAQARGYRIFTYHPDQLALIPGQGLSAKGQWIRVQDRVGNHVEVIQEERLDLTDLDVILMRQDPPLICIISLPLICLNQSWIRCWLLIIQFLFEMPLKNWWQPYFQN